MKKSGMMWLALFIVLQLFKLYGVNLMTQEYGQGRIEAYLKSPIDYSSFTLQEGYKSLLPAVLGKQQCTLKVKEKRQVTAMATDWCLPQIETIHMDNGAFFGEGATYEGRNVVVISDTLAASLLGSKKATGNTCEIDGVYYQIVGVYTHYNSFKDTLCDKGEEVVYLPITSTIGKNSQIETVLLTAQADGATIEETDLTTLGLSGSEVTIYNATDVVRRLKSLLDVALTWLGVIIVIQSLMRIFKLLKEWQQQQCIVEVIGLLLADVLVMLFLIRSCYIPQGSLPPYNLFDVTYYIEAMKKQLILHNQILSRSPTDFEALFWWIRKWSIGFTFLQFFISFKLSHWILSSIYEISHNAKCFKRLSLKNGGIFHDKLYNKY